LEALLKSNPGDERTIDQLSQLYERMLANEANPAVQFKLVKLRLKRQELDAAIGLLQQLVTAPEYRRSRQQGFGLCFWQKGMRYLALAEISRAAAGRLRR